MTGLLLEDFFKMKRISMGFHCVGFRTLELRAADKRPTGAWKPAPVQKNVVTRLLVIF
jgi:hypothetical protein